MDRRTFARAGVSWMTLALVVSLVGACTSGSSPAVTPAPAGSSNTAVPSGSVALPSGQPSSVSPASTTPGSSATTVPSVSASGAKPRPTGDPCTWLDKATIDAALGMDVGKAIPNVGDAKGKICTWLSTAPKGGITLAILPKGQADGIVANYKQLPGGRLVEGVGLGAAALFVTGQKAPLPNSHGQVFVNFGDWGLSVDVSGPAVTVEAAAQLAAVAASH